MDNMCNLVRCMDFCMGLVQVSMKAHLMTKHGRIIIPGSYGKDSVGEGIPKK